MVHNIWSFTLVSFAQHNIGEINSYYCLWKWILIALRMLSMSTDPKMNLIWRVKIFFLLPNSQYLLPPHTLPSTYYFFLLQWFLNIRVPGGLCSTQTVGHIPQSFWWQRSGWGLRICIFNRLHGDADPAAPGATVRSTLKYIEFVKQRHLCALLFSKSTFIKVGFSK